MSKHGKSSQRLRYKLVARYKNNKEITAYSLECTSTKEKVKATPALMGYLVGQGRIENVTGQMHNNTVTFKGRGIEINKLPTIKDDAASENNKKDSKSIKQEAERIMTILWNNIRLTGHNILIETQKQQSQLGKEYVYMSFEFLPQPISIQITATNNTNPEYGYMHIKYYLRYAEHDDTPYVVVYNDNLIDKDGKIDKMLKINLGKEPLNFTACFTQILNFIHEDCTKQLDEKLGIAHEVGK